MEDHRGPGAQVILHSSVETSEQVVYRDVVDMSSNHSEPDNIQDIVLEAQHRASLQVTLIVSLVEVPDLRVRVPDLWGLSVSICSGSGTSQVVNLSGQRMWLSANWRVSNSPQNS